MVMSRPKTTAAALIEITRGVTSKWAKQRKAEERHAEARANRIWRMTRVREDTIKDIAYAVMEEAYLKASADGTLPAHARQIMYQARPLIQAKTEKPLNDQYFCQQLLPNYVQEKSVAWNVVYDDRGHFTEPHSEEVIGLGTLNVGQYLDGIHQPKLLAPELKRATVCTLGPAGSFGAVLFVEKEGSCRCSRPCILRSVTTLQSCRRKVCRTQPHAPWSTASAALTMCRCWSCMTSTSPASLCSARYSAQPAASASDTITG